MMRAAPSDDPIVSAALAVAVDPDGGSAGQSVADVVARLRERKNEGWYVAEVDADTLADLIEALGEAGLLVDG